MEQDVVSPNLQVEGLVLEGGPDQARTGYSKCPLIHVIAAGAAVDVHRFLATTRCQVGPNMLAFGRCATCVPIRGRVLRSERGSNAFLAA